MSALRPDGAKKDTGCPLPFEFQINNEKYFRTSGGIFATYLYNKKRNEKFVYLKLKCNWVPYILSGCSSPTVRQRGGPGSPLPPALLPSETLPVPWKQAVGDVAPLACVRIGGL